MMPSKTMNNKTTTNLLYFLHGNVVIVVIVVIVVTVVIVLIVLMVLMVVMVVGLERALYWKV